MAKIINYLPELNGNELIYVANLMNNMSDDDAELFTNIYKARRREPLLVLVASLAGLLVIPGLQRFILNQIGMGILYLLTIGLCFIGSIVDLVNYQRMAFEYNRKIADEAIALMNNGTFSPEKSE